PESSLTFDDYELRGHAADPALFRPYPGLREATYYLHLWSQVLTVARGAVSHTLVVDTRGRPVLHIGDEAVDLTDNLALSPEGTVTHLGGTLDVVYFSGNDYEDDLREAGCIAPSEAIESDAAWRLVRHRELGVKHSMAVAGRMSMSALCPGLSAMFSFGGSDGGSMSGPGGVL
ncbi:MAG: hypothetical protein KUG77_11995, partial [Nannocystaceae bacterium]|nr:hypothetical protein [Nannocystaceae bacterium]